MTTVDAAEQVVTDVWSEVLRVTDLGPDDDFFARGGHSIQAIQTAAALQERFGVDLPMSLVFEAPTVRLFTAEVRQALAAKVAKLSDDEVRDLLSREPQA